MGFLSFRKKRKYSDYRESSHAAFYEMLAIKLNTKAQHIYEIAHGKELACYDDRVIWSFLVQEGVVT